MLPGFEREARFGQCGQHGAQIVSRKTGLELFTAIMMMNAIAEPHTFEIKRKGTELRRGAVALITGINRLEHTTDAQIVTSVLVIQDVTPLQGRLGKIVNQLFLTQGEVFKPLYLIAQHLNVGKLLVGVLKMVSSQRGGCGGRQDHGKVLEVDHIG